MPREVISQLLIVCIALAVVGIAFAVLIFWTGIGAVKPDIVVEKVDLVANRPSIIGLRNTGNVDIIEIERIMLECSSATIEVDPGLVPTPLKVGSSTTLALDLSSYGVTAGQQCSVHVKAITEGGYGVAATSGPVIVRSS